VQNQIVAAEPVAQPPADPLDEFLEPVVLEGGQFAAALAPGVVMVVPARIGRLVAGGPADVDTVHEPVLSEDVERPVDAREADAAVLLAQRVEDLLCAEDASLLGQEAQDLLARPARAESRVAERVAGVVRPAGGGGVAMAAQGVEEV
jgi:hypothetical protein